MTHALLLPACPTRSSVRVTQYASIQTYFFISVRDIVCFDNDAIVGKALENSRDVGLRVKVHELGLEVLKVHESR